MRDGILINLFSFTPASATGVFVYIDNLVQGIVGLDKENTYWIVAREDMHKYLIDRLGDRENVRYVVFGKFAFFLPRVAARLLKKRNIFSTAMRRKFQDVIDQNHIKAVFFPSGSINPQGLRGVKTVATLFDLQYEYYPDNFPAKYLKIRREGNYTAAKSSDHILTISEFTKASLVEKYSIDPSKITVTPLASQKFSNQEKIQLPDHYIFYPAGLWPHKNHLILMRAFTMLKDKFPELHVVLTGIEKWPSILIDINREAKFHDFVDRIHCLGHVRSNVLHCIYKNAAVLAFPSGFEGFGIPIVEAFSLGVPVIASNNSSIPEVVGDAGILVSTGDAEELAGAIERVLLDDKLRTEMVAKGYERAKLFSWEKTAKITLQVFRNVLNCNI